MIILNYIKKRYYGTSLARFWHRWAPSFTVSKRFFGQTVFMDFRDNIDDFSRTTAELEKREKKVLSVPAHLSGSIWDVGANVGLFSVRSAVVGCPCIAFEFSDKACRLLQKTIAAGRLPVTVVNRAFTATSKRYNPARTSDTENQVKFVDAGGSTESITYWKAEEVYGKPVLIKMDIEGGELEFFENTDFKQWLCENEILWLVEVHTAKLGFAPHWEDVPHYQLDEGHVLYCSNRHKLDSLTNNLKKV